MEADNNKDGIMNSVNWNEIIKLDAMSIDGASLGQVQGLFEPFVIIEKGTINKETYYIPKSVSEKYDQSTVYFRLTEQEVKNICLRDSPPSEEDTRQIQAAAERLASTPRLVTLRPSPEEEILRKIKEATGELKEIIVSGSRWAKEKIDENQTQKDTERISKMGEIAATFTDSFDQVMSEIKTAHTYEEQEQIYDGFIKLLEQQRELIVARKDLASKLKSSVTEPSPSSDQPKHDTANKTPKAKEQNKEKIELGSGPQEGGFVLSTTKEASTAPSALESTTIIKNQVEHEPFMIIKPTHIKYSKVVIKPSGRMRRKLKQNIHDKVSSWNRKA